MSIACNPPIAVERGFKHEGPESEANQARNPSS
jgi:hypothetical protein